MNIVENAFFQSIGNDIVLQAVPAGWFSSILPTLLCCTFAPACVQCWVEVIFSCGKEGGEGGSELQRAGESKASEVAAAAGKYPHQKYQQWLLSSNMLSLCCV